MKIKLAIAVLVALILAGTSMVGATPGQTQSCDTGTGGCHALSSSISVTTNITSITVSPGQSFAVGISWSGGQNSSTSPAGTTEVNWPTTFSTITRDNTLFNPTLRIPAPSPAGASGTTSSVLTAPAAVGNYIVRVYTSSGPTATGGPDGTNFKDINVIVAAPPVETFNISGFKINDTNGNGVWDAGEMGIENWNIKLFNNSGTPVASTSTNAQGFYQFTNLMPDRYNVTEEMRTGFTPTNATTKAIIVENMDVMNVNFTNQVTVPPPQTFNISGFKINDTNGNGVWDAGEMGIGNWKIMLLNDTGVQLANTSTNASGFYQFMNIFPGNYNVAEEMKTGFTSTNATSMPVTVENMDVMNVNFTNQITVTPPPTATFNISGFKVNDTNGNNVWESGEMGIENWNIRLLNATTGTQIASTSTNASGFYQFMNLAPGVYNVTEEMRAGFTPSGATFKVVTIENMDVTDVDFLNHITVTPPPSVTNTISGFKINDLNGNGKQDAGEEGLPGWNIRLIGIVPETVSINMETTTDDKGFYSFENLPAGKYLVVETLKGGYVPSGSPVLVVTLENGMNSMNNNFMNRPVSSLIPDLSGLLK
ncbi:SdrD B-like domain protein [uncultured archaeon]|nr:SdrD B-like domain protein [uncultured archaeon]